MPSGRDKVSDVRLIGDSTNMGISNNAFKSHKIPYGDAFLLIMSANSREWP
jgi:hypothetical protein